MASGLTITGDLSAVITAIEEVELLIKSLDSVPKSLAGQLEALLANLGDEITMEEDAAASGAGEFILRCEFRSGGRFEACMAAARAFCSNEIC